MSGWLDRTSEFLNSWVIRIAVISSFVAHLVLVLFAVTRRREASGVRRFLLWLAYSVTNLAEAYVIGKLFFGSTSLEQQLVACWEPFLLMHLGRPDNISAYSLEDNALSGRQVLRVPAQVAGAIYVLHRHIITGRSGTLLPASVMMFFVGIAKYVERAVALWRGDLGNIRSSEKKKAPTRKLIINDHGGCGCQLMDMDNEQALLVAQDLFPVTKGAFADYGCESAFDDLGWKEMCKVAEMELSLMYDILYTKAAVVHTWGGYGIRIASPPFTVAALLLFMFYSKDGQRRADVAITYMLLLANFFLDVAWLLRALASTWTYAFLKDRPRCWLSHELLCRRRWHRLRRFVVSLEPSLLSSDAQEEPSSYRMWSGTIGQYSLLHECTHDTASICSKMVKKIVSQDNWMEYQYHYSRGYAIPQDVRELLFENVWRSFTLAYAPEDGSDSEDMPTVQEDKVKIQRVLDEALNFRPEFQEVILIWHVATEVFLSRSNQNASPSTIVKAIKALSDYMVFLVAVRPYMVPGLKLSSLYEATNSALEKIRREAGSSSTEELASTLWNMEQKRSDHTSALYASSVILSDGTKYAEVLLLLERLSTMDWGAVRRAVPMKRRFEEGIHELIPELREQGVLDMAKLLELIFNAWVRLLIHVSIRCSRDSHAKQLSRGGELTTVVWMLVEHAGIFRHRR